MGSNYFVQVVGKKRWYFMKPLYSWMMYPIRNGALAMMTSQKTQAEYHPYMPLQYVDLLPGDMLYNPDWYGVYFH